MGMSEEIERAPAAEHVESLVNGTNVNVMRRLVLVMDNLHDTPESVAPKPGRDHRLCLVHDPPRWARIEALAVRREIQ